jgi:hypothetical protein
MIDRLAFTHAPRADQSDYVDDYVSTRVTKIGKNQLRWFLRRRYTGIYHPFRRSLGVVLPL